MKIKNISGGKIIFSDLRIDGTFKDLEMVANQELTIYNEDAEKSAGLSERGSVFSQAKDLEFFNLIYL